MNFKSFIISLFIFLVILSGSSFPLDKQDERFYIAVKAYSDGFYGASISLFKRFMQDFPQSSKFYEAKLYLAKSYYFKEEYLKALQILNEMVNQEKTASILDQVYYWIGEINLKGKSFNDALIYAKKIIEEKPNSKFFWWANYLAARAHLAVSQNDLAQKYLKQTIENCKEITLIDNVYDQLFDLYLKDKKYSQIINLGDDYLKKYPKGSLFTKVNYYLGKSHHAQRKFIDAIDKYSLALKFSKDNELNDRLFKELALSFLAKDYYSEAKDIIDKIKKDELKTFSQSVYYLKVKDYDQALEKADSFLKDFPKSEFYTDVYLNKADIFYEMGRINDAIYVYNSILENFKNGGDKTINDRAQYGLAWCYLKNAEFKKAIEEFRVALKHTDNPIVKISAQIQIADTYQEAKRFSEAMASYNEILENSPNNVYADYIQFQIAITLMKMEKLEDALFALRNLEINFPTSKLLAEARYYLAVGYFSAQEYQAAQKIIEDFIEKYQKEALLKDAYYLYGKCFFNQGDYQKALDIFYEIIARFKDGEVRHLSYIDIGNAYLNLSLPDRAKKIWGDFLAKFPDSRYVDAALLSLAGLYEQEKNYREAEDLYKKVIDRTIDTSWKNDALFSLAHLYINKGELDEADKILIQLSKRNSPLALKAKLYLAKIFIQRRENKKALTIYEELIRNNSSISNIAMLEKAYLFKDMKKYSKAADLFRKIAKDQVDSPKIHFYLAMCLEKTGRNQEAIDEYFKTIYTFDHDGEYKIKSYFRIAKIYEEERNLEGAKEVYKKLIEFDIKEAKIARARLRELEN